MLKFCFRLLILLLLLLLSSEEIEIFNETFLCQNLTSYNIFENFSSYGFEMPDFGINNNNSWFNLWKLDPWHVENGTVAPYTDHDFGEFGGPIDPYENILFKNLSNNNCTNVLAQATIFVLKANDDAGGIALRYENTNSYYLCYITNDDSPGCFGPTMFTPRFVMLKVNGGVCSDYIVASWIPPSPNLTYISNFPYKMSFMIANNTLYCSFDFNRNGVIEPGTGDPLLIYEDKSPLIPTPRVGIWSFDNGGSSFTDINITFCGEIPKNLTNQTNLANQSETINVNSSNSNSSFSNSNFFDNGTYVEIHSPNIIQQVTNQSYTNSWQGFQVGPFCNSEKQCSGLPGQNCHVLVISGFNFSIPNNSIIDSIVLNVQRKSGLEGLTHDQVVQLIRDGVAVGPNYALPEMWSPTWTVVQYPLDYPMYDYSIDRLWRQTWTPYEINNNNFGFLFQVGFADNSSLSYQPITCIADVGCVYLQISYHFDCSDVNECSGHGICVAHSVCTCLNGWTGESCSQFGQSNGKSQIIWAATMGSFSLVICFGLSLALFYYIGKRKVNQNKEKDDIPLEQSDSSYPSHTESSSPPRPTIWKSVKNSTDWTSNHRPTVVAPPNRDNNGW
jgi:hypothetical protein